MTILLLCDSIYDINEEHDEYSKKTTAAGYGVIAGIVEFTVLDEEGKQTNETYPLFITKIPEKEVFSHDRTTV